MTFLVKNPLSAWVQKQHLLSLTPKSTPFKQAKEDDLVNNGVPIREAETNDRVVTCEPTSH